MAKKKQKHNIVDRLQDLVVPISELVEDPDNAVMHDSTSVNAIARSLQSFGQDQPLVVQRSNSIVRKGNGRLTAAKQLGWTHVAAVYVDEDDADAIARAIADNRTSEHRRWDADKLTSLMDKLKQTADDETVDAVGWTDDSLAELMSTSDDMDTEADVVVEEDKVIADSIADPVGVRDGDVWALGSHRLMCGDSTNHDHVAKLVGGVQATLVHADPPYGMGKEQDGIANDNLYGELYNKFQMDWWQAWRPHLSGNGSVYMWGNASELWGFWYGRLAKSEQVTFRNEIVWWKGMQGQGSNTATGRMYASSERCLFWVMGSQGFDTNTYNYFEGWEGIRGYLAGECDRMGWSSGQVDKAAGTASMASHWITTSQWSMITEDRYDNLREASGGKAFAKPYGELRLEYEKQKKEYQKGWAYFNNQHDSMKDVWEFSMVTGQDRFGHATPKPVQMMARAILSSSQKGDVVLVPFGGTCPEVIAAEQTGRSVRVMEMNPEYCEVIIKRWETHTGNTAEKVL